MKKYISDEEINDIFYNNAYAMLNNEEIKDKKYIPFKKSIFGRWK